VYCILHIHFFTVRQNIVVYARKFTYGEKVLWPENLGTIAIVNYTFNHSVNHISIYLTTHVMQ